MDRPVVSVIIPVYNVAEYIEKAVDSICSQSLTDWEMFIIDDGSTDGTGDICDSLAFADSRIRVIHQENQGVAAARNLGIERSAGKYLYFMDGDDWAAPEMLYEMVCLAEHYYLDAWAGVPVDNRGRDLASIGRIVQEPSQFLADEPEERCAQLVIASFYIETYSSETEYYIQKQAVRPKVFADKSEFRNKAHELFDKNLLYTPWNKLYLASYIKDNDIRFINRHWDDFPFNLDVIKNIERVCVTDNAYYHFIRQRANSESEKYNLALYSEREEENEWLIGLYDTWRRQEAEKLLRKLKDTPENSGFLEEPEEPDLLTGTVGYVTVDADNTQTVDLTQDTPDDKKTDLSEKIQKTAAEEEVPAQDEAVEDFGDKESSGDDTAVAKTQPKAPLTIDDIPVNFPPAEAKEFIARRYIERIVGCVENVSNPASGLSTREKREQIRNMITKDSVRQALKKAKPRSLHMKAMLLPIRMKSTTLTYLEGALISKVKSGNVTLFARLKNNR